MPKSVVCYALDSSLKPESLKLETVAANSPGEGEVLVRVFSCGLAFSDLLRVSGKYQQKDTPPFVPGSEICGEVLTVGANVTKWKIGDRVFGASPNGALTEEVVVPVDFLYPLPPGVDVHVAAGFELNYGTTYHALHDIAQLKAGETVLVLGASGGVGLAAVDIAKALGARVVACASSAQKLEMCRQAGADVLLNYESEDFRAALKKAAPQGLDVVYDPVGGKWAEPAIRSLAFGGRFLVIGFAAGGDTPKDAIPKIPLNLALLGERKILGCFWGAWKVRDGNKGNAKNIADMMAMVQAGRLKPLVSKVYPLDHFRSAFQDLSGRVVIGKICIAVGPSAKL